jgi:predicted small lipoprotein YifL
MRTTTRTLTVAACVLALAGCTSAGPSTQDPSATAPDPSTTADPSPSATSTTPAATGVPPEVMLPETSWQGLGPEGPREESAGVVGWRLPESCDAGTPAEAVAMRTVAQGSGETESPIGLQQVVLMADADAAVAEVDRLTAALTACTRYGSDSATTYVVEQLDVGAQGLGLATDYYGSSAGGSVDDAIGSYLALTRRGAAVTLVGFEGGEGNVAAQRDTVTATVQEAWGLLCAYDAEGC